MEELGGAQKWEDVGVHQSCENVLSKSLPLVGQVTEEQGPGVTNTTRAATYYCWKTKPPRAFYFLSEAQAHCILSLPIYSFYGSIFFLRSTFSFLLSVSTQVFISHFFTL